MSTQIVATKQADTYTPPRAGLVSVIAVTTAAGSQDLRQLDNQALGSAAGGTASAANIQVGLPGCYVDFFADGADVGVVFGATAAAVTGGNAPSLSATGVNGAGCCMRIPSGSVRRYYLEKGVDLFVGFVASASGNLRIVRSSPFPQAV